jgi:hypothetical protein
MGALHYWGKVISRAAREALGVIRERVGWPLSFLLVALGGVLAIAVWGNDWRSALLGVGGGIAVIALLWFCFFISKIVSIPECDDERLKERIDNLTARLEDRAHLEINFDPSAAPYNWHRPGTVDERHYRIGVFNRGPRAAENVKVWLRHITETKCQIRRDFPYRVARAGDEWGTSVDRSQQIPIVDVSINPNEEELFEAASTWTSSMGKLVVDKIDTKPNGKHSWIIEQDEDCYLDYEVTAANADPVSVRLRLYVEDKAVRLGHG